MNSDRRVLAYENTIKRLERELGWDVEYGYVDLIDRHENDLKKAKRDLVELRRHQHE